MRALLGFYLLACLISWGWSFSLLAGGLIVHRGQGWPTHFVALFGPALAAMIVSARLSGWDGVVRLVSQMTRWRLGVGWWIAAVSPLGFLAVGLVVAAVGSSPPRAADFALYTGWPELGIGGALLAALLNGFGEELGWRGFLLPGLHRRYDARSSAFIVAGLWALWHLPFFFLLESYREFGPFTLVGFLIGITAGSVVLTWLYFGSGQSVTAVAIWHASYNMAAATAASAGTVAAVVSALVIVQAILLLRRDERRRRQGGRGVLDPSERFPTSRN